MDLSAGAESEEAFGLNPVGAFYTVHQQKLSWVLYCLPAHFEICTHKLNSRKRSTLNILT
jgi:hypothetical protein